MQSEDGSYRDGADPESESTPDCPPGPDDGGEKMPNYRMEPNIGPLMGPDVESLRLDRGVQR